MTAPTHARSSADPERFTPVAWEGEQTTGFKVEIQIDGWDRHRLLEDLSRTFSEAGMNIVEAQCTANPPMIRNRFVVECADTQSLKTCIARLRNIDSCRRVPGRVIRAPRP
jgi:guanosine-3',5'-bis(diphosphate) 3'-pyrophosphohydrolase